MQADVKALWAKKSHHDENLEWLPLLTHLYDTGYTINWLYNHWLSGNQRQLIGTDNRIVKFIGFIHDWGKATPAFQAKSCWQTDIDAAVNERLMQAGWHDIQLPVNATKSLHATAGEVLLCHAGVPASIAAIIGGHHGMYTDTSPISGRFNNFAMFPDNYQDTTHWWQNVQANILQLGLKFAGYAAVTDLPEVTQAQAALLSGLLIMADWLASSAQLSRADDTPLFPLVSLDTEFDDIDEKQRYQVALTNWELQANWVPQPVASNYYQTRFGFTPRSIQRDMAKTINNISAPGIVIIEAPMGYGKTEIALAAAEQMATRCGSTGVFFALPTQATANAMFTRVRDWMHGLTTDDTAPLDLKLMHGKARFNKAFQALTTDNQVSTGEWFTGKKTILDEFVVGTVDQILLMALKQKHIVLKHLGLSNKVVIIDEVHSYDVFMATYLVRALHWLGAYHVPVILLSATLPTNKRQELMSAYLGQDTSLGSAMHYPVLTYSDGQSVHCKSYDNQLQVTTPVKVHQIDDTIKALATRLQKISQAHAGVIGVILNTVRETQELASLLHDESILVLHASFLAPDRARQETKLQNLIGKNGKRPKKLIVIGTQVLEQSLDIDFDVLFTDLAPMDMLLQRIGRMHRHTIKRPDSFKAPCVYVRMTANSKVYSSYVLLRTQYYLPAEIDLTHDIAKLVNLVYANDTLPIENFESLKIEFEQQQRSAMHAAETYRIDLPSPKLGKTLHGWLHFSTDTDLIAHVRNGVDSLEVVMLQQQDNKLYTLAGHSINTLSDAEIAQQTINLPGWLVAPIDKTIDILENETSKLVSEWKTSLWLKGCLMIVLDRHMNGLLYPNSDIKLHYDLLIGLFWSN